MKWRANIWRYWDEMAEENLEGFKDWFEDE